MEAVFVLKKTKKIYIATKIIPIVKIVFVPIAFNKTVIFIKKWGEQVKHLIGLVLALNNFLFAKDVN